MAHIEKNGRINGTVNGKSLESVPSGKARNADKWEVRKLGEICENLDYKRIPITQNKRVKGEYPYYGASGIVDFVADYLFDENLLLVSEDGANLLARTYPIAFSIEGKAWVNNHAHVLRFQNIATQKYVEAYLNSISLEEYISGMAQPKLNQQMLNKIPLPIPTLPEQQRIVSILDEAFAAIDKAKANVERNLQNAKELFESELNAIFSNKGEDWEEKRLGDIAKVIGGYSFKSGDFQSSGKYQVLRMGNVRPGVIRINESPVFINEIDDNTLQKALLLRNDVIITQTGTKNKRDYGFTVIVDKENYLLNQRIAAIRFSSNYLSQFFLYFSWTNLFRDQYFANETGTVGQGNVGIGAITNAKVPFPSLDAQSQIVRHFENLSNQTKQLETKYQQKLMALEELKKSILQKAFSGELSEKEVVV